MTQDEEGKRRALVQREGQERHRNRDLATKAADSTKERKHRKEKQEEVRRACRRETAIATLRNFWKLLQVTAGTVTTAGFVLLSCVFVPFVGATSVGGVPIRVGCVGGGFLVIVGNATIGISGRLCDVTRWVFSCVLLPRLAATLLTDTLAFVADVALRALDIQTGIVHTGTVDTGAFVTATTGSTTIFDTLTGDVVADLILSAGNAITGVGYTLAIKTDLASGTGHTSTGLDALTIAAKLALAGTIDTITGVGHTLALLADLASGTAIGVTIATFRHSISTGVARRFTEVCRRFVAVGVGFRLRFSTILRGGTTLPGPIGTGFQTDAASAGTALFERVAGVEGVVDLAVAIVVFAVTLFSRRQDFTNASAPLAVATASSSFFTGTFACGASGS